MITILAKLQNANRVLLKLEQLFTDLVGTEFLKYTLIWYRGVAFRKDSKTFRVYITVDLKKHSLGNSKNPKIAGLIYNSFVLKNNLEHNLNKFKKSEIAELRASGHNIESKVIDKSGALAYFMREHLKKDSVIADMV